MATQPVGERGLNPQDVERKANDLVQLLLLKEQGKVPVKRADIVKYVLKEQRGSFNLVMDRASLKMRKVFGMEIVSLGEGQKKCYMLKNNFEDEQLSMLTVSSHEKNKQSLLMIVLSLIFMSGDFVDSIQLWKSLSKIGIDPVIRHSVFGDCKKLIFTEFVRQMYLDVTKVPNTDPPQSDIRWGLRASLETNKMKVLKFVSDIYDKTDLSVWRAQYDIALKENK